MTLFQALFLVCAHLSVGENISGQRGISRARYQPHLNLGKFLPKTCVCSGKTLSTSFSEITDGLFLVDS